MRPSSRARYPSPWFTTSTAPLRQLLIAIQYSQLARFCCSRLRIRSRNYRGTEFHRVRKFLSSKKSDSFSSPSLAIAILLFLHVVCRCLMSMTRRLSLRLDNGNFWWSVAWDRVQGSQFILSVVFLFVLFSLCLVTPERFVVVRASCRFPRSSDRYGRVGMEKSGVTCVLGNFANRFGWFVSYTHRCERKPRLLCPL